jgi:hypothetical protein
LPELSLNLGPDLSLPSSQDLEGMSHWHPTLKKKIVFKSKEISKPKF